MECFDIRHERASISAAYSWWTRSDHGSVMHCAGGSGISSGRIFTGRALAVFVLSLTAVSGVLWMWTAGMFGPGPDSPIFQIATPANAYNLGTPFNITLTLSLPPRAKSPTSAIVSTFGLSTVRVKNITRDGLTIQPLHGVSDFIGDPFLMQDSYIQTITSGDTVVVPWTV